MLLTEQVPQTDLLKKFAVLDDSGYVRGREEKGWIIVLIILILAVAGGTGFYFMQRQKPISATEDFLENMRAMNFDGMKNLLQSNDMSALDNADITSDAYSSFFKKINEKMTYKIGKTNFHIQNGTASVTVHINYIDGADIYKETISEFLKQIVSTAFSGTTLTEEETQQKLASLLEEKSGSVEDKFTSIDITYPLIEADGKWKNCFSGCRHRKSYVCKLHKRSG